VFRLEKQTYLTTHIYINSEVNQQGL
jgi:hypothetical protein